MTTTKRYIQVECAVGWSDHTWSDGYYAYLPEDTPEDQIEQLAVQHLMENELRDTEVEFVTHYCTNESERFTAFGTRIDEQDG